MIELDEITLRTVIIDYLKQYKHLRRNKENQEERLKTILADLSDPIVGKGFEGSITGFSAGSPQERLMEKLEEALTDYTKGQGIRIESIAVALMGVMNIIELLPDNSDEHEILLLRYIDALPWQEAADKMHMTMRNAFYCHDRAIDQIIKNPKTLILIEPYAKANL